MTQNRQIETSKNPHSTCANLMEAIRYLTWRYLYNQLSIVLINFNIPVELSVAVITRLRWLFMLYNNFLPHIYRNFYLLFQIFPHLTNMIRILNLYEIRNKYFVTFITICTAKSFPNLTKVINKVVFYCSVNETSKCCI